MHLLILPLLNLTQKKDLILKAIKDWSLLYDELTERGCYCMLTNHNTKFINDLYGGKGYTMDIISVKRLINSDASKRDGEEIIICNF